MKAEYGLLQRDIEHINNAFKKFKKIDKAVIFGSRAMGNYKKGSDIDVAVFGENITRDIILRLYYILEEKIPVPYFFDIVHFEGIKNDELKELINTQGKILFEK